MTTISDARLVSHEVIVQLIAATTTRKGLKVRAEFDGSKYPAAVQISDQELAAVPLRRHVVHPNWNYTIAPAALR